MLEKNSPINKQILQKLEDLMDKIDNLNEEEYKIKKIKKILNNKKELTKNNILFSVTLTLVYSILIAIIIITGIINISIIAILTMFYLISITMIQVVYQQEKKELQKELKEYNLTFNSAKDILKKITLENIKRQYLETEYKIAKLRNDLRNKNQNTNKQNKMKATPNPKITINKKLTKKEEK